MNRYLFAFLFCILVLFSACKIGGNDVVPKEVSSSFYKEINSSPIDISSISDKDTELYMFVYNIGNAKIQSDSYKDIFNDSSARSVDDVDSVGGGIIPLYEDEYAHYTCGLSSKRIRDAYNNHVVENSSNARSASGSSTYDRSKNKAASNVGYEADFYKEYTESDGKVNIKSLKATCQYVNDDCQIFVENDCYDSSNSEIYKKISEKECKVTQAGVKKMAEKFSKIYKAEQALLGEANLDNVNDPNIIETSEKITILIANLGMEDSGDIVMGYFYPNDLYCCYDEPNALGWYSNQRMMFTLNVLEYGVANVNGEEILYSTFGHEFNHMINYIKKELLFKESLELWFTEMLSSITEDFIPSCIGIENKVQDLRIPFFNVGSYVGLNWKNSEDVLATYGFTYAFGAYLVRNYGGVELIHQMATNRYDGKDAIDAALKACGYEETFDSVFLKFGLVMANADGKDSRVPTLNKRVVGNKNSYSYVFDSVDLRNFRQVANSSEMGYYCNPGWSANNNNGPCFYKYNYCPSALYGIGFYAIYLGKASDWGNSLRFNPPSGNLKAYIYIRNYL